MCCWSSPISIKSVPSVIKTPDEVFKDRLKEIIEYGDYTAFCNQINSPGNICNLRGKVDASHIQAALKQNLFFLRELIQHGFTEATFQLPMGNGDNLLHVLARQDDRETMGAFFDAMNREIANESTRNAICRQTNNAGDTPLLVAARRNNKLAAEGLTRLHNFSQIEVQQALDVAPSWLGLRDQTKQALGLKLMTMPLIPRPAALATISTQSSGSTQSSKITELAKMVAELKASMDAQRADFQQQIDILSQKDKTKSEQIDNLTKDLETQKKINEEYTKEITQLKSAKIRLESANTKLERINAGLESEITQLKSDKKRLESENAKLRDSASALQEQDYHIV